MAKYSLVNDSDTLQSSLPLVSPKVIDVAYCVDSTLQRLRAVCSATARLFSQLLVLNIGFTQSSNQPARHLSIFLIIILRYGCTN